MFEKQGTPYEGPKMKAELKSISPSLAHELDLQNGILRIASWDGVSPPLEGTRRSASLRWGSKKLVLKGVGVTSSGRVFRPDSGHVFTRMSGHPVLHNGELLANPDPLQPFGGLYAFTAEKAFLASTFLDALNIPGQRIVLTGEYPEIKSPVATQGFLVAIEDLSAVRFTSRFEAARHSEGFTESVVRELESAYKQAGGHLRTLHGHQFMGHNPSEDNFSTTHRNEVGMADLDTIRPFSELELANYIQIRTELIYLIVGLSVSVQFHWLHGDNQQAHKVSAGEMMRRLATASIGGYMDFLPSTYSGLFESLSQTLDEVAIKGGMDLSTHAKVENVAVLLAHRALVDSRWTGVEVPNVSDEDLLLEWLRYKKRFLQLQSYVKEDISRLLKSAEEVRRLALAYQVANPV